MTPLLLVELIARMDEFDLGARRLGLSASKTDVAAQGLRALPEVFAQLGRAIDQGRVIAQGFALLHALHQAHGLVECLLREGTAVVA